ncbi:hypothetical protein [Lysinibacillus fusiformis]|uniref:hypothetical protein n=1 Tax=Lysinibacillus fusiformis TaxID=28031 RepID=UPI003668F5A8
MEKNLKQISNGNVVNIEELYESLMQLLEQVGGIMPFTSSLVSWWQHRNFNKRVVCNEAKIKEIMLSVSITNAEFIYTKVAPMVFEKIVKDQEDEKAELLLLGFDNCVKNDLGDEDIIIYYFDLLTELRVIDLKRLFTFSKRTNESIIIPEMNSEQDMLLSFSDSKLIRLGLINERVTKPLGNDLKEYYDFIEVTSSGNRFLDFIGI